MSVPDAVFNQTRPDCPHGSWVILGVERGKLFLKATGCGVESLRDTLDDTECSYVLLGLRLTLQEIPDQLRQIFIQWKGPNASGMAKVKANQLFQQALDCLSPNHGQLEAVGKTEFTEEIISTKWLPSAGSHVIN